MAIVINPYAGIQWDSAQHIKSFSHMHTRAQANFDWAYSMGYRHFPGTHYQPAYPTYPLTNFYTLPKLLSFNGQGNYVNCGTGFNITNTLELEALIKIDAYTTYPRILGAEDKWMMTVNSNGRLHWYGSGVDSPFPRNHNLLDGNFHKVKVVYAGDGILGYVDGRHVGTIAKTGDLTAIGSTPVTIGDRVTGDRSFDGIIKWAKVSGATLQGYWKLEDGVGETAADQSGNGNHGTILGATWIEDESIYAIGAPNSEKVNTSNGGGHFNALGSFYESPGHNWDIEVDGAYLTWQEKFTNILNQLQFPSGGGVHINHNYNFSRICEMLDFDTRVLGMEIYNDGEGDVKNALQMSTWDAILKTGRRCWGFCTIDWVLEHKKLIGSNILVVPEFTEQACLEAYRNGGFYGILEDTGMRFTNITAVDKTVSVKVNRNAVISFVTENGIEEVVTGSSADFTGHSNTFVRVEVQEPDVEWSRLFSQPIIYSWEKEKRRRRVIIL